METSTAGILEHEGFKNSDVKIFKKIYPYFNHLRNKWSLKKYISCSDSMSTKFGKGICVFRL